MSIDSFIEIIEKKIHSINNRFIIIFLILFNLLVLLSFASYAKGQAGKKDKANHYLINWYNHSDKQIVPCDE